LQPAQPSAGRQGRQDRRGVQPEFTNRHYHRRWYKRLWASFFRRSPLRAKRSVGFYFLMALAVAILSADSDQKQLKQLTLWYNVYVTEI